MWPPPSSREEIDAANRYATYGNGWRDGAATRVRSSVIASHPDENLRAAYDRGYRDGARAYEQTMLAAQQIFDHTPSLLRA